MAMIDCEACWNAPCRCGAEGYVAVYPRTWSKAQYADLGASTRAEIQRQLEEHLERLLASYPKPRESSTS